MNDYVQKRAVYNHFVRNPKYFGNGEDFHASAKSFLLCMYGIRGLSSIRDLLNYGKYISRGLFKTLHSGKYDYNTTYDYLKAIDKFLVSSSAMNALIETYNSSLKTYPEIDYEPILPWVNPKEPSSVIDVEGSFDNAYSKDVSNLDDITLLGNTIYYSNKATKFLEAAIFKIATPLLSANTGADIYVKNRIDALMRLPSTSNYISSVLSDKQALDYSTMIDSICEEIKQKVSEGKLTKNFLSISKEPKIVQMIIDFTLSKNILYDIKNISTVQLLEKITEFNKQAKAKGTKEINYKLNDDEYGIAFEIPYFNFPVAIHLPIPLYTAISSSLTYNQRENARNMSQIAMPSSVILTKYTLKNVKNADKLSKNPLNSNDPNINYLLRRKEIDYDI